MHRAYLDGHHIVHWAHGGETTLENLVLLCGFHHAFVHEHGYRIEMGADQKPRYLDPRGRLVLAVPRPLPPSSVSLVDENADLHITADTNRSRWDGTAVDCGAAVRGLWVVSQRGVSA